MFDLALLFAFKFFILHLFFIYIKMGGFSVGGESIPTTIALLLLQKKGGGWENTIHLNFHHTFTIM